MSPPALSRGPPRSPASGLQPAGAQLSMLGTHSGNFSPNSALEFLTLPTPFGEIVPSVLGRPSESSHGESVSVGDRRNVAPPWLPWSVGAFWNLCQIHFLVASPWPGPRSEAPWGLCTGGLPAPQFRGRAASAFPGHSGKLWGPAGSLGGRCLGDVCMGD